MWIDPSRTHEMVELGVQLEGPRGRILCVENFIQRMIMLGFAISWPLDEHIQ